MLREKQKVRVWHLGWNGMEKRTVTIDKLDSSLKVNDWHYPKVGELCINSKGKLDICKSIYNRPAKDPFKGYVMYTFKYSKVSSSECHRVDVRKGRTFKFRGRTFTYKPPKPC